jgi:hypothetical protein
MRKPLAFRIADVTVFPLPGLNEWTSFRYRDTAWGAPRVRSPYFRHPYENISNGTTALRFSGHFSIF